MSQNTPQSSILPAALLDAVDRRIAQERGIALPTPQASAPQPQAPQQQALQGEPEAPAFGTDGLSGLTNSFLTGIVEAGFQTKDFLTGGAPAQEDKSWFRQQHEGFTAQLQKASPINSITHEISQFGMGLVGAGKLLGPIQAVQKVKDAGVAGRTVYEVGRGALAGFLALDPHEERLSNLIQQYEPLRNPVTEYLAAQPGDSAIEGRFKNALEGIGLDLALVGILEGSLKAIKAFRNGDQEAAQTALREVEELQAQYDRDMANQQSFEDAYSSLADQQVRDGVLDAPPASSVEPTPQAATESTGGRPAEVMPTQLDGAQPVSGATVSAARAVPDAEVARAADLPDGPTPAATSRLEPEVPTPEGAPGARPDVEPVALDATPTAPRQASLEAPGIVAILDSARADLAALRLYGSRSEAAINGHKFADRTPLPWQKLRGTDEVQAFLEQAVAASRARFDPVKGGDILSDPHVTEMVAQRTYAFAEDPSELMAELVRAGDKAQDLVANMEASFLLSQRLLMETHEMASRYRMGNLAEWGGDAQRAGADLQARFAAAMDMLNAARSMRAATGRAMRRMRSEFKINPEDIEKLRDVSPDKLADLLYATQGNPRKLVEAANPNLLRRIMDEANFSITNSLLWLWPTHAVNLTSNLYMLAARPTEKILGSLMMGTAGGTVRRQALKEYAFTVASIGDGWSAMVEAFKRGDSVLAPFTDEYFTTGSRIPQQPLQWKPIQTPADLVENGLKALNYRVLVGLPTRSLGAVDEFMKSLRYRAVIQAQASVEAAERGLKGADLEAFIESRLAKSFDAEGRALDADAMKEAQVATFQQELLHGTTGKAIQTFRQNMPVTTLILPFVKTPINVLRYAWKMTPGLNVVQKEYRQMLSGKMGQEAQAQALGQMALGATFMSVAGVLAASGRLTGSGPQDPQLIANLRATGWQPYSLTWEGEDGERHYFPLGRFDPISLSMSMVADLVELQRVGASERSIDTAAATVALALAKSFQDRTFLQNLNAVVQAASHPDTNFERWAGQTASNVMPFSSLLRGTNPDPYLRDARTVLDNIMAKLPGFSETLPPRRDAFGEPVWQRIGLATTQDSDIVEAEHNRIMLETDHGIRPPSPHRHGVDLRKVTLSNGRNAYDLLQEYTATPTNGQSLKSALARLIESDGYANLVDGDPSVKGTKIGAIMDIVARFRDAGFRRLRSEFPELREMLAQQQMDVLDKLNANREQDQSPGDLEALLKSMGY